MLPQAAASIGLHPEPDCERRRISVFGTGYVGVVSCGCLANLGHQVVGVDIAADKVAMLSGGRSPIVEQGIDDLIARALRQGRLKATTDVAAAIAETEVSFICVGTPSRHDGAVSLDAVETVVSQIGTALRAKPGPHTVVLRSTVPPGTAEESVIPRLEAASGRCLGEDLAFYVNPEFLREGSSVRDFHAPPFTVIGAPPGDDAALLRNLYSALPAPVHVVPYRVAESVKHVSNVFHALKLAFANEAGSILRAHNVDAREVFRLICEDRVLNISPAYLRPGFAFGGSCLPKDVRSFVALANQRTVAAPLIQQLLPSNAAIVERTYQAIARHGRQPVAVFGLAFKSGTDDLRESPFVALAEKLIGKGFDLRIFDRHVDVARLTGANRAYIDREIPHLERVLVPTPAAALSGAKVAVIGHVAPEDRPALLQALDSHTVIDLLGLEELSRLPGVTYEGLCW
ncbi:MAG TPA: nucleotide sugar dehydrogenase [Caulobacteraceae bacterium]